MSNDREIFGRLCYDGDLNKIKEYLDEEFDPNYICYFDDINDNDICGWKLSPLMIAVIRNNEELVKLLFDDYTKISTRYIDTFNVNALMLAAGFASVEIFEFIRQYQGYDVYECGYGEDDGLKVNCLFFAAYCENNEMLDHLLSNYNFNLNVVEEDELSWKINLEYKNVETMRVLLKHGFILDEYKEMSYDVFILFTEQYENFDDFINLHKEKFMKSEDERIGKHVLETC